MVDLPALIRATAKTWDKSPKEINWGDCEFFAEEVIDFLVEKGELRAISPRDDWFTKEGEREGYWRHAWIYLDGRHYDSECPKGVKDWKKLPFFLRCAKADKKTHGRSMLRRRESKAKERKRLDASAEAMVRTRQKILSEKHARA